MRHVDQSGSWLLLDKHGTVEALIHRPVRGVGDIGREHIVLARLLGCYLEPGPDAVPNLKHTMRAISRRRDIDRLMQGWRLVVDHSES